jgi:hypothetical protein
VIGGRIQQRAPGAVDGHVQLEEEIQDS